MSTLSQPRSPTAGPAAPLVEELAPGPDPWEAARRLAHLPHLLFLDSAAADSPWGRYSFVTADPFAVLRDTGRGDPFAALARRLARLPAERLPGLPPFQGGAAGLFGYDLCHHVERLPRPRCDEFAVPPMVVGLYDWVVSFDHRQGRAWLVSTGLPEADPARRRERAGRRLREVLALLAAPPRPPRPLSAARDLRPDQLCPQYPLPGHDGVLSNFDRPGYLAAARRAVEYVHAGDCFQVNIAQRLLARSAGPPLELYGRLRERNAAPFAGYFQAGRHFAVASASPERFLRVTAGGGGHPPDEVQTHPIKGTRPRGRTPEEDQARAAELLASAKDRAENVMIVDLLRNDLGRVCQYGSVRVEAVCRVESFRYVHHLVSEVRGRLRPGLGPVDLLRAAFPGGSVTGAPKVRAMEIIAELEPTARGPYCGCLGYIGFDGAMDTSILIRTFTAGRGWVQFPVGGGIVADSVPEQEHEETLHKAEGLLLALPR
ncbi:MAG TPA: anthranilate synthase component I family protein [Gemmataceae bacterium]|nr:anthranilate synthase component I family protein [Gemmataceae bacterium]